MTEREALKLALEALENNRQTHHYCEDTWYSCPKHEDGCANDAEGDECNCGADKANAEIDATITAIKEALMSQSDGAQPEQEPVTWRYKIVDVFGRPAWTLKTPKSDTRVLESQPLYTTPPPVAEPHKRKPLTEEDAQDVIKRALQSLTDDSNTFKLSGNMIWVAIVKEVEAKLKQKNEQ